MQAIIRGSNGNARNEKQNKTKQTVHLIKNDFSRHFSRINAAKERISELEDRLIEITKTGI